MHWFKCLSFLCIHNSTALYNRASKAKITYEHLEVGTNILDRALLLQG